MGGIRIRFFWRSFLRLNVNKNEEHGSLREWGCLKEFYVEKTKTWNLQKISPRHVGLPEQCVTFIWILVKPKDTGGRDPDLNWVCHLKDRKATTYLLNIYRRKHSLQTKRWMGELFKETVFFPGNQLSFPSSFYILDSNKSITQEVML